MIGFQPQFRELSQDLKDQIVARIRASGPTARIVLFGSRARRDHRPGSDIDILVVQESALARYRREVTIRAALNDLAIPVDIEVVVYTPAEVDEWRDVPAALVTTALREGEVWYEEDAP